ncbi:MAG: sulfite exporter TauE/SafE family protein, partial [Vicinamibacterales bacterium]
GLLFGVAGSLHCVLMCGPLVAVAGTGAGGWRQRAIRFGVYHGGRGGVYVTLAATAALFGRAFALVGLGSALSVACGVLLLAAAVPTRVAPRALIAVVLRKIAGANALAHGLTRDHPLRARFLAGVVNGLLPCGLTYAAALTAATMHGVPAAMLFMAGFWAGTLPALVVVSLSAITLPRLPTARLRWVAPAAMAVAGLLLIVRGLMPLGQPAPAGAGTTVHHHGMTGLRE